MKKWNVLFQSVFECPMFRARVQWIRLWFGSLFYNSHLDTGYVADTLMEPMFWFVDHFTLSLGPVGTFLDFLNNNYQLISRYSL